MKIAIISPFYPPEIVGGGEISTQILAENLNKYPNISADVFTIGKEDGLRTLNGVDIYILKSPFRHKILQQYLPNNFNNKVTLFNFLCKLSLLIGDYIDLLFYNKIKNMISDYDIIHITNMWNYSGIPLTYFAAKRNHSKVIQSFRAPYLSYQKGLFNQILIHIFNNIAMKNVDLVHTPSNFMLNKSISNGLKVNKSKVIYNTVENSSKNINWSIKKNQIVYVGVIEEKKGVLTLLKSMSNLKGYKLILVGEGSLSEKIQKEFSHIDVEITGWIDRLSVNKIIEESMALVLPSEWDEAFGRVIIEAISENTLVIGSDAGAIPEVLNYTQKYIFKQKNVSELTGKLRAVINYDQTKYEEELDSMTKIMAQYSINNHIASFIDMYKTL